MIFNYPVRNQKLEHGSFIRLPTLDLWLPAGWLRRAMFLLIFSIILLSWTSCVPVRGYQKVYLADDEMILKDKTIEAFEIEAESYREGASGANGGKTGGGCGCN